MPLFNLGQGSFVPDASTVTFDSFELGTENPVVALDVPDIGTVEVSFGTNFEGQASTLLKDGVFTLSDSNPNGPLSLDSEAAPVFTANDDSADTNPVLSGTPTFNGPISVLFSQPVAAVGLTGGFFDAAESTSIEAFDVNGNSLGLVRNTQTGFEFFGLATDDEANDIAGISFYITDNEPAGFEIDNLTFGTIEQVEATLSITSEQAVLTEGSEGTTAYSFTVERNGAVSGETTVNYNVVGAGENPASEADFVDSVFPSGTLTFAPDETEKTITVEVAADTEVEADEKFEVTLSEATGGAIGLPTAESIIQDDDEDAPASLEPNDTIDEATLTNLTFNNPGTFEFSGAIGNNPNVESGLDVDIYTLDLAVGDEVIVDIDAEVNGSNLDSVVQIFDESGERVAVNDDQFAEETLDSFLSYSPIFSGTYYVAVSGFSNVEYDVFTEGSGSFAGTTGEYDISIEVEPLTPGGDEPNDTFDDAVFTQLSSENPGRFDFTGSIGDNPELFAQGLDVDLFEVQLDAGDLLTATIDTIDVETALDSSVFRVFDENGNELLFQPAFSDRLSDSGVTAQFVADTTGTYYLGTSGFGNFDYDPLLQGSGEFGQRGDYNLSLEVSSIEPTDEPNDIIPTARIVSSEEIIEGFSSSAFIGDNPELNDPNFDVDLYSLFLEQGETISIDLDTPDGSALDLMLRVFNSNGGEVGFSDDDVALGEVESFDPFLEFTAPFAGQYYIGVSDIENDFYSAFAQETGVAPGETGSYTIEINSTDAVVGEFEDPTNDTLDTAIPLELGDSLEGAVVQEGVIGDHPDFITVPGLDVDLYSVELENNQQIGMEVSAQAINSPLDSFLRVFNSEGEEVAFNDDFNESDSVVGFTVSNTGGGTYYIGVSGIGNTDYDPTEAGTGNDPYATTGEYSLTVFSFGNVDIIAGPEEPNDTISTATATELTPEEPGSYRFTEGFIGDNPDLSDLSLDVDFFQVDLAENSLLTVDIDTQSDDLELNSNLDSVVQIFNSEGELLEFNDNEGVDNSDSFIEFTPGAAGSYYIGVSGLGNNGPDAYDPNEAGSGNVGGSRGSYVIEVFLENVPVEDPTNDTIETALPTGLNRDNPGSITESGIIGDNNIDLDAEGLDVDLYKVQLKLGDELNVNVETVALGSELDPFLRIFNSAGEQLTFDDDSGDGVNAQLTFTPEANDTYYVGVSNFLNREYDATVEGSGTDSDNIGEYEVTIDLTPGAPVEAINDELSTDQNTVLDGNVLNNDSGEEITVSTVNETPGNVGTEITTAEGALLTLNADGTFSYNPDGTFDNLGDGETATDSFTYTVTDAVGQTATATATIIVTGVVDDDVVDAVEDPQTIAEQETFTLDVLDNDLPADGLTVSAVNGNDGNVGTEITTQNGALVTLNADGSLTYDPNGAFDELNQGQTDTDSFTYTATDDAGNSDQATVTVTIEGVTDFDPIRPTANNDIDLTGADTPVTIDVLNNDTANDQFGDLEIDEFDESTEKGGTITLDESGEKLIYTPDPDFSGEDSFTYTITNESGEFDEATVNVTVNPSNPNVNVILELADLQGQPLPNDAELTIGEEFLVNVRFRDLVTEENPDDAVTSGYADIFFDPTRLQIVEDDSNVDNDGFSVNGIIHAEDFNGFRKGTVDNVQGIVDETGGFFPGASQGNLPEDNTVFTVHLKAVGGGDARIAGTTTVGSNAGEANNSAITILSQLADQRELTNFGGLDLDLLNPNITAMEVKTAFEDLEGNPIESVNVGEQFKIILSAEDLRPEGDKLGVFSAFADVNYDTVLADVDSIESAGDFVSPVIDLAEAIKDGEGLLDEVGGTNSDFTPVESNTPQRFAEITATATAQGEFEVTLDVGDEPTSLNTLFGLDFDVNAGTDYFGDSLSIVIAPPELEDDAVTTDEETVLEANVLSNDTGVGLTVTTLNGDAGSIGTPVATEQGALVTLNADGTFSYDPNGQFDQLSVIDGVPETATDSFTYAITDQAGQIGQATVTVTINGVGDPGDAINDSITIEEEEILEGFDVLDNDRGVIPLTVTAVNGATESVGVEFETEKGALVTLDAEGNLTYDTSGVFETLNEGQTDTDSFTYTMTDSDGNSDEATVTITINGSGVDADAIDDSITLNEGVILEGFDVLDNDFGVIPLTVTAVNDATESVGVEFETEKGALVTLDAEGNLTYDTNGAFEDLNQGETDTDSFTYTITDDDGNSDQATVNFTINGVGAPDLVVTGFDVENDHVLGGEATVSFTVENQGDAPSSGFQVEIIYFPGDNPEEISEQTGEVVSTLAFGGDDFDPDGTLTTTISPVSLPVETLLAEAIEDDPSVFGEPVPEEDFFQSNNIDYLGIRIVDDVDSGEDEEAFANNGIDFTEEAEGVNLDDIAYFPWDVLNNQAAGVVQGGEDSLISDEPQPQGENDFNGDVISDGDVTTVDANAVFQNIGRLLSEDVEEVVGNPDNPNPSNGLDLDRIDAFDPDGAISPVDAVRVVNRVGYRINPNIVEPLEDNGEVAVNGLANDGIA